MPRQPTLDPDAPPPAYATTTTSTHTTTLPSSTQTAQRPWHAYITLDLLVYIASRSVFHPAITLIFYLCIAALHKHREPIAFYTLYWCAFLCIVEILLYVNRRVSYGPARKVDWAEEVVVITGGGSGLGRVLMESLVMRGVKVAVLDTKIEDGESRELKEGAPGSLCWEVCDVGILEEVERAVGRVVKELGPPTILINNAAAPINGLPLLPAIPSSSTATGNGSAKQSNGSVNGTKGTKSNAQQLFTASTLHPSQATNTLQTNTLSHFNTLHTLLPHLLSSPRGALILTISSILSHLSPAYLSDYAASKAAISSLHSSLSHEIASHPDPFVRNNIKTLLVEVGQMDTSLFADTKLNGWFWGKFIGEQVQTKEVVRWITWYLERGEGGVLRLPFWGRVVGSGLWGLVPGAVERGLRGWSGIDSAVGARR